MAPHHILISINVDAERNYEIYNKEMLTIIHALEDWRHYLEGLPQPFDIISDHRNLQYWHTAQNLTRRQARWSLYLSRFDFLLTHKPGISNTQADPFSHFPTPIVTDADNNQQQIILQPSHFLSAALLATDHHDTLEDNIHAATDLDPPIHLALKTLHNHASRQLLSNLFDWEEHDGLVFFKECVYIPQQLSLQQKVVRLCHDSNSAGHPGQCRTLELVSRLYWWPGMATFVKKFVSGCDTCQQTKPAQHPCSTLQPHDVPEGPWQTIGIDLITSLSHIGQYNAIVVYIDHYSKQVHILPTTSEVNMEGIANIHYCEIF